MEKQKEISATSYMHRFLRNARAVKSDVCPGEMFFTEKVCGRCRFAVIFKRRTKGNKFYLIFEQDLNGGIIATNAPAGDVVFVDVRGTLLEREIIRIFKAKLGI